MPVRVEAQKCQINRDFVETAAMETKTIDDFEVARQKYAKFFIRTAMATKGAMHGLELFQAHWSNNFKSAGGHHLTISHITHTSATRPSLKENAPCSLPACKHLRLEGVSQ